MVLYRPGASSKTSTGAVYHNVDEHNGAVTLTTTAYLGNGDRLLAKRDEQAKYLAKLMAIDPGGDITTGNTDASTTAVPEPGAWMLLGTVLFALTIPRSAIRRRGRC